MYYILYVLLIVLAIKLTRKLRQRVKPSDYIDDSKVIQFLEVTPDSVKEKN